MLIEHPRIYLDARGQASDALLIRDGRVLATGGEARSARVAGEAVLRPDGACLFPALGDAHIHLFGLGLVAGAVDLRGLNVEQSLRALAGAKPQQEGWIFGSNRDENHDAPDTALTIDDLDRIYPDNPVCIRRVDGHALWVNSAALERARFDEIYRRDEAGEAERDPLGRLTGRLVDNAMNPVLAALPDPGVDEDRAVLLRTAHLLRDQGISFCTLAWCPVNRLNLLKNLDDNDELPIHIDVLVDGMDPALDQVLEDGPRAWTGNKLRIAGIKFFADGAMGSAGAHLLSPYRTGGVGLAMHKPGFLRHRIPELMVAGWQVAVHAIGDAAVREVLDAFAQVPTLLLQELRPRLEHAQIVAATDAPRFAKLNVIASIQPIHLYSDAPWAARRLHDQQLQRLFPWRALFPATLCAGSDYPIDDLNPWHGVATALTRKGSDGNVFAPHHRLTRQEILASYTEGAAFACRLDERLGRLEPGFRAEILLLDTDPFTASPEEIWHTKATFLGE